MAQVQKPAQPAPATKAPTPSNLPKILRIGIIQSGKIVEERLVRKRENVTIGQSAKNTFVMPASNAIPKTFTLFELTAQGYALNFTEGMDGRIAFDQNVAPLTLGALRAKSAKRGDTFNVLLNDRSRGKVVIDDVTVLFQFVAPPPIQPRPQLPPSVRGSVLQGLDWALTAIVGASLIVHVGFVVYLQGVDWPRKPDIEAIPDRFVQMVVPKKVEKQPEKVDPNAQKDEKKVDDTKKKGDDKAGKAGKEKPQKSAEQIAAEAAARRERMANEMRSMGMLKILTAKGDGSGAVGDLIKHGDASGDADKVFAQVGGVQAAGAGDAVGLRGKDTGGSGTYKGIAGLRASGPGEVATGTKAAEKAPKGILKDAGHIDVDGSLSPDVVAAKIRQGKSAIIICYERALKRNPNLGGKVVLDFTISAAGKVVGASISDDSMGDDEVKSCITSTVKGWMFPRPEGGEVRFSYPFIFQAAK